MLIYPCHSGIYLLTGVYWTCCTSTGSFYSTISCNFQQAAMLFDVATELQFHSPMVSAAGGFVSSVDYDASFEEMVYSE